MYLYVLHPPSHSKQYHLNCKHFICLVYLVSCWPFHIGSSLSLLYHVLFNVLVSWLCVLHGPQWSCAWLFDPCFYGCVHSAAWIFCFTLCFDHNFCIDHLCRCMLPSFDILSLRYCSVDTGVIFACLPFLVTILPFFVILILFCHCGHCHHGLLLCHSSSPPSSLWTATVYSSLCHNCKIIVTFLILERISFIGWLDSNIAGFGSPGLIGINLICKRARLGTLCSMHFSHCYV